MKKILRVIHSVDPKTGGPVEGIKQISPILKSFNYQTHVLSFDNGNEEWISEFPLPLTCMGLWKKPFYHGIGEWIQKHPVDCVIVHGLWQTGWWVYRALKGTDIPYYIYPHGMLDPWQKSQSRLKFLKKQVYWKLFERHVIENATRVLFTSELEKELASQTFHPYKCQGEVVSYGVQGIGHTDREFLKKKFFETFPRLHGKKFFLFLGRIHSKKGCDLLIQAFEALECDSHLLLAGPSDDSGYRSKLSSLIHSPKILLSEMLKDDLKWGAFLSADAFVLPSHQENFGLAVVEALASGLPVLISDKVNIHREIKEDYAGLVEEDSLEGTLRLLKHWNTMPLAGKDLMRKNAYQCYSRRYSIEQSAEKLISVLEES